ncbi:PmoA family protein [Microbacterium sp.]|uniref:DUF6807 domain-containing protein n=1 Tax=Microbacterium sp. TaxID=51671 RepID=UPI0033427B7E
MTLQLIDDGTQVSFADGDAELMRYVYRPDSPQLEAPRPYLHPIRTRRGHEVSLFRPWDHVWHKGIAWSLPVVDDENFWGGPTFVRGEGYVQLPNDGAQRHAEVRESGVSGDDARFAHRLEWIAEDGRRLFDETRSLGVRLLGGDAWGLVFDTTMTNITPSAISIGSPTTRGRDNAGYGGLFWRGPRSFTDGVLVTPQGTGTGAQLRGQRHEWMGFSGRHDVVDAVSLVVMVDAQDNPRHPPQWFARSEEFAGLNPAPFFSDELKVPAGGSVRFRYAVGIADAGAEQAPALAVRLRALLAPPA